MFTGIIEGVGIVLAFRQARLRIKHTMQALQLGESIAINGVCLTVEAFQDDWFEVYVSLATMQVTNLKYLAIAAKVNLERALVIGQRLGGHFMTGHVDAVAQLKQIRPQGASVQLVCQYPRALSKYLVPKGSIALDGVSLTVTACGNDDVTVTVIPATVTNTTINSWRHNYQINLEVDILSKYAQAREMQELNVAFLAEHGFIKEGQR